MIVCHLNNLFGFFVKPLKKYYMRLIQKRFIARRLQETFTIWICFINNYQTVIITKRISQLFLDGGQLIFKILWNIITLRILIAVLYKSKKFLLKRAYHSVKDFVEQKYKNCNY